MELLYIFIFWAFHVYRRSRKQTAQKLQDIWDQRDIRIEIATRRRDLGIKP